MRKAIILAALLAAALPVPAPAMTIEQINCPLGASSPEFQAKLGDVGLAGDADDSVKADLIEELGNIAGTCVAQTDLPREWRMAYPQFAAIRILNYEYGGRLYHAGIATSTIDEAMDLGVHGSNPDVGNGLTADQAEHLSEALDRAGVDMGGLSDDMRRLLVAYIATTSAMYRTMAELD